MIEDHEKAETIFTCPVRWGLQRFLARNEDGTYQDERKDCERCKGTGNVPYETLTLQEIKQLGLER